MRRLGVFVAGLGSVVALAWPSPAAAAHWTRITDPTASNIDEVSLARTPDGFLHVAWTRPAHPASGRDLVHVRISPGGSVGTRQVIASDWATLENPALVATGGRGLAVYVGAMRSTHPSDPIQNLARFTSTDGGQTWSLQPSDVADGGAAYASDTSAALGSDGTPFEAWGSSSCLCVHRGNSPSASNTNFQSGLGDFGYEPGMALDSASGHLVVAWFSNATHHTGVYAATVDQSTAARAGAPMLMPGTSNLHDGPFSGRTQIVARAGGGLYVAYEAGYPSHTKVLVWRVGSGASAQVGRSSSDVTSVGVARTSTGRLWAFWSARSRDGTPLVYVRRSNPAATKWGATVVIKPPAGAESSWNLVGNGQATLLDLVGSFSLGTSSKAASWYTQVLPGLSLTASRRRLKVGGHKPQRVTFTVDDAGAAVGGAKVKVGHVHGTTGGDGQVTLSLGPFAHRTRLVARTTHAGYSPGSLVLKVR